MINVGGILLVCSTVLYALAFLAFAFQGDKPMAIVYAGYTLANVGVVMLAYR